MIPITAEAFRAALKKYMEEHKLNIASLARKLEKGQSTVGDWVRTGIKRDDIRQKIAAEHPEIFGLSRSLTGGEVPGSVSELGTYPPELRDFMVLMKTESAHCMILNLTAVLSWFLFKASAEDRNRFRDIMGDEWIHLLELTRAMTNEAAFKVAQEEGRLDWCQS